MSQGASSHHLQGGEPQLVKFTSTFFSGLTGAKIPQALAQPHYQNNNNNNNNQQQQQTQQQQNTNYQLQQNNSLNKNSKQFKVSSSAVAHRRGRDGPTSSSSVDGGGGGGSNNNNADFGQESSGKQLQYDVQWLELGLCKALTRAVSHLGYLHPTPVQSAAIPPILAGYDICARAVTGSGKTAALLLPLVHRLVASSSPSANRYNRYQQRGTTAEGAPKRNFMTGTLRSLILLPSRELGTQMHDFATSLSHFVDSLRTVLVIGGVAAQAQESALAAGADIVVATPGRIIDLLYNYSKDEQSRHTPFSSKSSAVVAGSTTNRGRKFDLSGLEVVALDECDELLTSTTLRPQIEDIFDKFLPPLERRQTIIMSATLTKRVDDFVEKFMNPDFRLIDIGHVAFAAQLRQHFIRIAPEIKQHQQEQQGKEGAEGEGEETEKKIEHSSKRKTAYLVAACRLFYGENLAKIARQHELQQQQQQQQQRQQNQNVTSAADNSNNQEGVGGDDDDDDEKQRVLIFTKHRSTVHRLCVIFQLLGLSATELRGDLDMDSRSKAISDFASGAARYLFTTDVASRGLDLPAVGTVINFDLPPTLSAYIHRVGRTARIGRPGVAVSLVDDFSPSHKRAAAAGGGGGGGENNAEHAAAADDDDDEENNNDAELMRRILALSKSENAHQTASVKRREVPHNDLLQAVQDVNSIFPQIKGQLAREVVEKQLELAERKMQHLDMLTEKQRSLKEALRVDNNNNKNNNNSQNKNLRASAIAEAILPQAKRAWTFSRSERQKRDEVAKKVYTEEVESKLAMLKDEAAKPDALIERANNQQIARRRKEKDKKEAVKDREKAAMRRERDKLAARVQKGVVKRMKQKKIREMKREKRAEKSASESGGGKAASRRGTKNDRKKSSKAARRKKFKRH